MKRFIAGVDREQSTLLPECLDDFIDESNRVRGLMPSSMRSIWPSLGSMEWSRRRVVGHPIILRFS
jgi:hypothetical protein